MNKSLPKLYILMIGVGFGEPNPHEMTKTDPIYDIILSMKNQTKVTRCDAST